MGQKARMRQRAETAVPFIGRESINTWGLYATEAKAKKLQRRFMLASRGSDGEELKMASVKGQRAGLCQSRGEREEVKQRAAVARASKKKKMK